MKGMKFLMNTKQETKEKICAFYASDYHFEMISLPYIDKKINEKDEVIILTENNLENTIQTLLSNMNLKEKRKEEILNINWEANDLEKFKKIKNEVENQKNIVIFIKGKENYIKNINKNIEKWTENAKNLKIIDCYDIEEVGENMDNVMNQYNKILNTSGEKEIKKI